MEVSVVSLAIMAWVAVTLSWITAFVVATTVLYKSGRVGTIQELVIKSVGVEELAYLISKYCAKGYRLMETKSNDVNRQRVDVRLLRWSMI